MQTMQLQVPNISSQHHQLRLSKQEKKANGLAIACGAASSLFFFVFLTHYCSEHDRSNPVINLELSSALGIFIAFMLKALLHASLHNQGGQDQSSHNQTNSGEN